LLNHELTPNHAGLALWGDCATLERLHEFVHEVVAESCVIEDKEGFMLGLAYDVRKAFQGERSESHMDNRGGRCKIYGVEILWPVILVQVGMLRHAMAFIPTNRLDQATMFELEHVVESAARRAMPSTADQVIHHLRQIGAMPYHHIDTVLNSRCCYFIELPAKKRLTVLPKLMDTFDPMYDYLSEQKATMNPGIIPPSVFAADDCKWPDFEW
jgi:hypothetical protein